MRVGLNLLYLRFGLSGGTQTYAQCLIQALAQVDEGVEYVVYVNREAAAMPLPDESRFRKVVCPVLGRPQVIRYAWEQVMLPVQAACHRLDVLHSLGYVGPLWTPCPHVVTICDMNVVHIGETMSRIRRAVLRFLLPRVAQRAARVLTISLFSAGEIARYLAVAAEKIVTTYCAPREGDDGSTMNADELCAHYHIQRPYVLAFGSTSPHKNIPRLVRAFACSGVARSHQLVLVGRLGGNNDIHAAIKDCALEDRVVITGWVPDEHIMPLLRHSDLFVFPSLHEGFGLPAVDAQRAGTVVACSNAGSLPEVVGQGAALFDPLSVDGIAEAIRRCLTDEALRQRLRQLGYENVARFSWKRTATETLSVYKAVCTSGKRR